MIFNENILREFLKSPTWTNENTINLFNRLLNDIKILEERNKELYEDNKILCNIIKPIKISKL